MKHDLHAGLKNKAPKAVDASMKAGPKSIDKDATRSSTAPTPATLGPRDA